MSQHTIYTSPACELMQVNRDAPAPAEDVNPDELAQLLTAFRRADRPGACRRTILAGIVATGSLLGTDYSQERDYAESLLLADSPAHILALA